MAIDRVATAHEITLGETPETIARHGNGFKTACTCAILNFYGIERREFKFCQFVSDMLRILRKNGFSCRQAKTNAHKFSDLKLPVGFYLVETTGHVALVHVNEIKMNLIIDTAPCHTRKNEIESVYRIGRIKKQKMKIKRN